MDHVLQVAVFNVLFNGGLYGVFITGVCVDHIPLCGVSHGRRPLCAGAQGDNALYDQVRHGVEHPDKHANDQNAEQDDDRVVDHLALGGPNDLFQLAAHLAEPTGNPLAGPDEDVGLLVRFCCHVTNSLLRLGMVGVLSAESAIFTHLKTVGIVLLVLDGIVVSLLALVTSQGDLDSHLSAPPLCCLPVSPAGEKITARAVPGGANQALVLPKGHNKKP